jgi:hypothetical protein
MVSSTRFSVFMPQRVKTLKWLKIKIMRKGVISDDRDKCKTTDI